MAWVLTDNIRGPRGATGSIASASAESVAADQSAQVIMTGTDDVKHLHIKVPRGLPGMNAVPADAGVAAYVAALETATRAALNGSFLNYVVWTGAGYPPRVPDAVNVFIGPDDPGLAMRDDDLWTNPDTATMSEVLAAIRNPSSPLYHAVKAVLPADTCPLQVRADTRPTVAFGASSPNQVWASELPKGGTNGVRFSGRIPDGWNVAALRYRWVHNAEAGGNARLNTFYSVMDTAAITNSINTVSNFGVPPMTLRTLTFDGIPVAGGQYFSGGVVRISDNASDTVAGSIGITDAWLVRIS